MQSLENITGRLAETYPQLEPDSIQHSAEIMNDRRRDTPLRNQWFWTADFPMYTVEEGEAVLYLAPGKHNLVFKNLADAVKQLRETGNYKPTPTDAASVIESASSGETLRVKLSELELTDTNQEWSCFVVDTENHEELNKAQRTLAEKAYGKGNDFKENMEMLREKGIRATRIYTLNPKYVETHAKDCAISRAAWLGSFYDSSSFDAVDRSADGNGGCLRGVRRNVAERDTTQKIEQNS